MNYEPKLIKLEERFGNWVNDDRENGRCSSAKMTKNLYPYDTMFSPIRVNKTVIKNRIVMGPMGNLNMCEESGRPNDKMLQYFFARAKGGAGLLTTGLIPISHGIDNSVTEKGKLTMFPRLDRSRTVFAGWRDLAQGVHNYGSRIFVQITPGLGRVGPPTCLPQQKKFPVSASMNPNFYMPELPCMRLSDMSLKKIVNNCGQAAADAKECGLDGIYLHGHEGYLLEQMTNPAFNRRKLGKYKDPERFGIDIVKAIRERVGPDYPIMYRIDLSLALNETYREKMDTVKSLKKFKNGRTMDDTLLYMKHLVEAGVDMFDVDLGCYDNWWLPHPPAGMPAGCFLGIAKMAKDYFKNNNILSNAGFEVPVVAVGKLGYPDLAESALRDGLCDMVMLARPLLADPEWPNKAYAGKVDEICPCIGCQEGCINEFVLGGHPQCAVNPRTGFEDVLPDSLPPALEKKKIAVIGGGPSGMEFAAVAAERGHEVTLFEKNDRLGGKIIPGSAPKIKFDFGNYLDYMEKRIALAEKNANLTVRLGEAPDNDTLKASGFDSIVFAYGTKEIAPPFKGLDTVKSVFGIDLLVKPELLGDSKKIVVVGGGVVGCEVAYWLKYEHGCDVTVVEMLPQFMYGVCTANRGHLLHYLEKAKVNMMNCAKVTSFEEGRVHIMQNVSPTVPDPYNTWQPILPPNIPNPLEKKLKVQEEEKTVEADLVVLAMGGKPDQDMYFNALSEHIAPEIYNIGDSSRAGRVLEATRAGYNLAMRI